MHIGTTEVQRPGNIVEGRHQHTVSMLLAQGFTDTVNLIMGSLSGIL